MNERLIVLTLQRAFKSELTVIESENVLVKLNKVQGDQFQDFCESNAIKVKQLSDKTYQVIF